MAEHLVSTRSSEHPCGRCRTRVYTAWAEGLHVTADAVPLDPTGEAAVLLSGRSTYTRTRSGELIRRDADRIRGGWLKGTIHAQHECGSRPQQGALF